MGEGRYIGVVCIAFLSTPRKVAALGLSVIEVSGKQLSSARNLDIHLRVSCLGHLSVE